MDIIGVFVGVICLFTAAAEERRPAARAPPYGLPPVIHQIMVFLSAHVSILGVDKASVGGVCSIREQC